MRKTNLLLLVLGFILVSVSPVIAQEMAEETMAPAEDMAVEARADEGVITGEVTSLDVDAGTVTVKTDDGEDVFSVVDGETILWKGIEDIGLSDVTVGVQAEVGYYTNDSGVLVASWVDVLMEEEAPAEMDLSDETEEPIQE
ncbi:MAG: hypothetical protein KKH08_06950 [Candidatus Omnitrophica bacterium]|nr:hypothetical protein [Candidatus Omnitrophota bacterium]